MYEVDKDGIYVGKTRPLEVCGRCGPKTLMYAGPIIFVTCAQCKKGIKARSNPNGPSR